ncbi:hypothetical protein PIB30_044726 [Stylosanthes scabra]|uniref:Zinc finger GRF-type domain-containing protein n=1 Tax=Stylosanthes scabra TaxID=79078 RepID=A0ABU6WFY2_9FABA|nr:hypothetical protein [Stylosanthes scabra]
MAAQNSRCSRSSRSTARTQSRVILCDHGEGAVLRVSDTKENPGRWFWGCVYYDVRCRVNVISSNGLIRSKPKRILRWLG